ncbi:hypothetical protein [Candidatus Burkholderia verschuerenii]|uniref:hypothetical protein n=1 Tax=Candidatus Burkholderia verschuerenii TaxID=242163 RepID=UPI0012EE6250|nr:hypothetical protein [Candidatus Burkholderia verschuerenii]
MAATNRWLTAADACVSRYPTKLAFCSRFRRQRELPEIPVDPTVLFGFCEDIYDMLVAKHKNYKNCVPTKHKKAGG